MRKTTAHGRKLQRESAIQAKKQDARLDQLAEDLICQQIASEIQSLRTDAGLQAYIGEDAARVANMAGRLVYITCYAAAVHQLEDTPEARILAGTANALGDIAGTPAELERQRGAVIAGLAAIDRLMPKLDAISLAEGSLQIDSLLLRSKDMSTADVRKALGLR